MADARRRLSRVSVDRHAGHVHPMAGTPVEVPVPRNRNVIFSVINNCPNLFYISRQNYSSFSSVTDKYYLGMEPDAKCAEHLILNFTTESHYVGGHCIAGIDDYKTLTRIHHGSPLPLHP